MMYSVIKFAIGTLQLVYLQLGFRKYKLSDSTPSLFNQLFNERSGVTEFRLCQIFMQTLFNDRIGIMSSRT